MEINLDLTDDQAAHLTAAVVEYYHRLKDGAADTTYGGMITDERVLDAREVWRQVESHVRLNDWA